MNEITVLFEYKASGGEIIGLQEFEQTLKPDYILNVRPNRGPQAGGIWDVFVEFYINISLEEFIIAAIAGGMLWDGVKLGTRKFLIRPIINAIRKLEDQNKYFDYTPVFRMTFDDVQLKFYGIGKGFYTGVNDAFKILFKHYKEIIKLTDKELFTIHIPTFLNEEVSKREVYVVDPHMESTRDDYTKFWALSYTLDHDRDVLDVKSLSLLDKDWERPGSMFMSR